MVAEIQERIEKMIAPSQKGNQINDGDGDDLARDGGNVAGSGITSHKMKY